MNPAQYRTMLRTLEELSALTGLDAGQVALLGDVRRALGIRTGITATLTLQNPVTGNVTLTAQVGRPA